MDESDIERWRSELQEFADENEIPLHSVRFYEEVETELHGVVWPCCGRVAIGEVVPVDEGWIACPDCDEDHRRKDYDSFEMTTVVETNREVRS